MGNLFNGGNVRQDVGSALQVWLSFQGWEGRKSGDYGVIIEVGKRTPV